MTIEPNETFDRFKKSLPTIIIVILILIIIGLVVYSLIADTKIFIITKLYNYAVNKIVSMTGISQLLVKGIVIVALIPLLWVIPHLFKGKYKNHATAIGMLYIAIFFLSLFFMSKDIYFSHSGDETLKWFALTPDGVRFFDTPGIDPVYGIKLKPVTPEVIRKLKILQQGDIKSIDPNNFKLFNPITGEAQAWYYKNQDGTFEFFDKPGYHPITGDSLEAVTKQVLLEWKEIQSKRSLQKPESTTESAKSAKKNDMIEKGISSTPRTTVKVDSITPTQVKKISAEGLKLLVNQGVTTQTGKPNVAIVLKGSETVLESALVSTTNAIGNSENIYFIPRYFKTESFISEGYFDEIYGGNMNLLQQANAMSKLNYLILGKMNYTFKKSSQFGQELVSCDLKFNYKIINKSGSIIRSDTKSVVGPGFSEEGALERSLEILNEKHIGDILKTII